jgi:exopolyphosphatase/guanosine-5'-triphosphate,3'-diphosphate pyrophosphatase
MLSRIAIIDIGTNTVNLLMVDKYGNDYNIVHSQRVGVGLGHGGINKSLIADPAFQRGVKCLNTYAKVCEDFHVQSIFAFGTSALRHATNASDFIDSVKKNANIDIKILNGQEEASLIYDGIRLGYDFKEKSVVMDIGGGSTEFILANNNGIIKKQSFEIGASRINQLFTFNHSFNKEDIYKIESYLDYNINTQLDEYKADTLIGSSGSFETFYELTYQKKYPKNQYFEIDLKSIHNTLDNIINSSLEERTYNKFIIPIRRKMLPIAAVKTKWVLNKLGCQKLIVSPNSLKEGAIFQKRFIKTKASKVLLS